MRNESKQRVATLFGLTPDGFLSKDHAVRRIAPLADSAPFNEPCAAVVGSSIQPNQVLTSGVMMAFDKIHAGRQFCEQTFHSRRNPAARQASNSLYNSSRVSPNVVSKAASGLPYNALSRLYPINEKSPAFSTSRSKANIPRK